MKSVYRRSAPTRTLVRVVFEGELAMRLFHVGFAGSLVHAQQVVVSGAVCVAPAASPSGHASRHAAKRVASTPKEAPTKHGCVFASGLIRCLLLVLYTRLWVFKLAIGCVARAVMQRLL